MKILKTALLSTTLMMGVTLGADVSHFVDAGSLQAAANAAKEEAFLQADAAFTANNKKIKEKLLELISKFTGVNPSTVTIHSKTKEVFRELEEGLEALVIGKTELETKLETAKGRIETLEAGNSTLADEKAAVEAELGRVGQSLTDANIAKEAAERELIAARGKVDELEAALEAAQAAAAEAVKVSAAALADARQAAGDRSAEVQHLKDALAAEKVRTGKLERELKDLNTKNQALDSRILELTKRMTEYALIRAEEANDDM